MLALLGGSATVRPLAAPWGTARGFADASAHPRREPGRGRASARVQSAFPPLSSPGRLPPHWCDLGAHWRSFLGRTSCSMAPRSVREDSCRSAGRLCLGKTPTDPAARHGRAPWGGSTRRLTSTLAVLHAACGRWRFFGDYSGHPQAVGENPDLTRWSAEDA